MSGRSGNGKKLIQGLMVGLAGAFLALFLWAMGWLDSLEAKTWDLRATLMAKPGKATDDIRLILVDQTSLDWGKEVNGLPWPWPREVFGAIIDYCRRCEAKALAIDVLFSEFSGFGVEDDEKLGASISTFGKLACSMFSGNVHGSETRWPTNLPAHDFPIIGLRAWITQSRSEGIVFKRASFPIPEVAENAALLCNVHLDPDPDGIYRRAKLFSVFNNRTLPSLAVGTYLAANPGERMYIGPGHLTIGRRSIPIDEQGNTILRYRGPVRTHKAYTAAQVLQSEIRILESEDQTIRDKSAFKDKYVLLGYSAPGLYEDRPAPVGRIYPGVEIHATVLDNLLSDDFIRMTPAWLTIMLVFVLAFVHAAHATFFGGPVRIVAVSTMFISLPVLLAIGSYVKGFWLPVAVFEMAAVATMVFSLVVNYATEGRQKRFIKNAFRQYLHHEVIEQIIQYPERLKLGGERRVLSIFFSDLQGFTSISESLAPEELTVLLNDYLSAMTDIVMEEGGTIDKYEGDAIIAFWNAPLEVSKHALRAVQGALRCQAKLAEMRPAFYERIGKEMLMRIGINTGPAVVGNFGSKTKFDYTMLGDAVNLASRLEGTNKRFGIYTMISQSTREQIGDEFAVREVARVAVAGRRQHVTVYEPMFWKEYGARREILDSFSGGLDYFYKGHFSKAQEVFSVIQDLDPVSDAYEKKCKALIDQSPKDWDGVWE